MISLNNYITEKLNINKSKLKNGPECTLFPETMEELADMIKKEIEQNGKNCSLNHIDTNKITDMSFLFAKGAKFGLSNFNGDISNWDVSNVTDMGHMFAHSDFNGNISDWDVSNVKNMHTMFMCSLFDGDLSRWNVSNVYDMGGMFYDSKYTGKNGSIGDWDISNVETMESMFKDSNFNGDISSWTIDGNFCDYHFMFAGCKKLEQKHYPTINHK